MVLLFTMIKCMIKGADESRRREVGQTILIAQA